MFLPPLVCRRSAIGFAAAVMISLYILFVSYTGGKIIAKQPWNNKEHFRKIVRYLYRSENMYMEDKRIKKTKKNLKSTLIAMLNQMSFEQITITELCRQSDTSRITFYKHYNDKYALADEIFQDYLKAGMEIYERRQQQNNHRNDIVTGYCNMLDSIFEVYYGNYDFFRHTNPEENPHLAFSF